MAITIRHDAAAVGVEPSKQNRRLGQQLVLQQQSQAFARSERDRERSYDNLRQEAQNRFQLTRDARARQADEERQRLGFEQQKSLFKDRVAAENEMFAARNQADQQQWLDRREIERKDLQAQTGQFRRDQDISSLKAGIAQADLTAEGKQKAGELLGNLKAIEAQRDSLRPDQYNGLIDKWRQDYEASGIDQYVKPVPKIDQEMKNRVHDHGTGYASIMQPDGRIDVREIDPSKTNPAKTNGASDMMSPVPANVPFDQYMQNPQQNPKITKSLYDQGKKYAEAKISQNADASASPRPATDEEIKEGMKQAYDEQQQQSRIMGSFQPAPVPAQAQPTQSTASQLKSDTVSPAPAQAVASTPQAQPPVQASPVTQPVAPLSGQGAGAAPRVEELETTLNASKNMSPEQRIATLMPMVKLGIPQDDYTSLSQWMADGEILDAFSDAVKAGEYKQEQYREYVLKHLDGMLTEGLTDQIVGMKAKQKHQSSVEQVVPALQQTSPRANTEQEAASLLENDFIAPDGTHRYKTR